MKKTILPITIIVVLIFVSIAISVIKVMDDDWSIAYREYDVSVRLEDVKILEIDRQLRNTDILKDKNVYLNEITLKTDAREEDIFDTNIEFVYSYVFDESKGEKRLKRYICEIDLSREMINKICVTGSSQLSGYEKNLELDETYVLFDDYIKKVLENNEIKEKYVNSESNYNICLTFRHYDRPYKAIVSNKKQNTKICLE